MCFPAFICSSHASPAVPLAPFIAHGIASVDMGGSEHCPAWPMYAFVAWLSCWDSTAANPQACVWHHRESVIICTSTSDELTGFL